MCHVWGQVVVRRARFRGALGVVLGALVSLLVPAPASAQLIDTFVSTGNAQARWIKDPAGPPGSRDDDSIELTVTARSAIDFNDAAWVSFLGLPSAPPAAPPSFLYKISDPGPSGGSVRLVMRFSDGGHGFLRPETLQAGQWILANGGGRDWENIGGATGCPSSGITYAQMLQCHAGATVTSFEIINDSGWLHSGPFRAEVDHISYGGELVTAPAPPVLGESVNVAPGSGKVKVRLPEGAGPARASQGGPSNLDTVDGTIQSLPVGSRIDTRHGTVKLFSSRGGRRRQSGRFRGAVFTVGQTKRGRNKGLTTLRLKTASRARCNTSRARRSRSGAPIADAARRRRGLLRRLRGRAKGRFRTRGRYSSAAVQGTVWTIDDRCEGTLVRVREVRVKERDVRRKRTVIVRAGQSYLAKAPGY